MTELKLDNFESLSAHLKEVLAECYKLREENAQLRNLLGLTPEPIPNISGEMLRDSAEQVKNSTTDSVVTKNSTADKKIDLFRSLFLGREDVYPVRWEGKGGKSGYSPACANEWKREFCQKPLIKCSDCLNRCLLPVTDELI